MTLQSELDLMINDAPAGGEPPVVPDPPPAAPMQTPAEPPPAEPPAAEPPPAGLRL